MWRENIGFRVDRKLKSAMQADDLEAIKKLLKPSKDPEEVSLNSLLPEVMQLGKLHFDHPSLREFCKLYLDPNSIRSKIEYKKNEKGEEEGKVAFNKYLSESLDILVGLIDYLVSKGADVNAIMDPNEHKICCWEKIAKYGKYILSHPAIESKEQVYKLSVSLYMPLAIGKFNIMDIETVNGRYIRSGDKVVPVQKSLLPYFKEQNDNMQIRLTQKLIDNGANLEATCISEKGHEINFLDFINNCGDDRFSDQKKMFLIFYDLKADKNIAQILKDFNKSLCQKRYPDDVLKNLIEMWSLADEDVQKHQKELIIYKPCPALKELMRQKIAKEAGKKLAFDITKASDNPIAGAIDFLDLKEVVYCATLTKEEHDDLSCIGQDAS
ncbi:hypothetical protein phytr_3240 [Candidatus Phycorickettsia trachydisci]|uniref:Ankyrin repeat protein n=1 Tax=Candidatus Phycorickettsia trachydisci TaxID=2115978 RepID=A0A2P1P7N4_9RICK|nr:hypothetical protein [Candidatus Phycorickettsia trachydisci]AVP87278.1 hypothetical protein phytr_3240 [Candidatus Phycorickettsia trachydisci]